MSFPVTEGFAGPDDQLDFEVATESRSEEVEPLTKAHDLGASQCCLCAGRSQTIQKKKSTETTNGEVPSATSSRVWKRTSWWVSHRAHCEKELSECHTEEEANLSELKKRTASVDARTVKSAQHERDAASYLWASSLVLTKLRAEDAGAQRAESQSRASKAFASRWELCAATTEQKKRQMPLQAKNAKVSLYCWRSSIPFRRSLPLVVARKSGSVSRFFVPSAGLWLTHKNEVGYRQL